LDGGDDRAVFLVGVHHEPASGGICSYNRALKDVIPLFSDGDWLAPTGLSDAQWCPLYFESRVSPYLGMKNVVADT
jgi:hypothetical protein